MIAYINTVIVYKRTVHIDNNPVPHVDINTILTMKIHIDMNLLTDRAKQLLKNPALAFVVGIVAIVQLTQ